MVETVGIVLLVLMELIKNKMERLELKRLGIAKMVNIYGGDGVWPLELNAQAEILPVCALDASLDSSSIN